MTENEDTPKLPAKPPLSDKLKLELERTLDEAYSVMPDGVMVEQARILDAVFRRGIYAAMRGSIYADDLNAALKAQNQYRLTIKALQVFDRPRNAPPRP
jgi:hypothetical protein